MSSLTSSANFTAVQESEVSGSNCLRVIIAFILRLFMENANKIPLPRHDWSLLVISGIIVYKFMISAVLTELMLKMKIAAPPTKHSSTELPQN